VEKNCLFDFVSLGVWQMVKYVSTHVKNKKINLLEKFSTFRLYQFALYYVPYFRKLFGYIGSVDKEFYEEFHWATRFVWCWDGKQQIFIWYDMMVVFYQYIQCQWRLKWWRRNNFGPWFLVGAKISSKWWENLGENIVLLKFSFSTN
jgi:hypothetical protein